MPLTETNQTPLGPTGPSRRQARRVDTDMVAAVAPDSRQDEARALGHPCASPCGLDPAHMSADERLDEVGRILAFGILRLLARQSPKNPDNPGHLREFGLDFSALKSGVGRKQHSQDGGQ